MAQHLPIQASIIVSQNSTRKQRSTASPPGSRPHVARRKCFRPPGGIHLPPGASVLPDPTVFSSPPGGAHRAARRLLSADPLTLRLSLGGFVSPPGAMPEQYLTGFSISTNLLVTYSLLWINKDSPL